ncbi:hypothetical protein K493DRAFT_335667 [Basidiobolus meristosporus CBS 931.73]|uniref:Uncharacterized protein n=1 Tax=Basidiobolus meristosporus CBS 931.73 TaxID=1314790 RepID=A0A1Y1YNU2_9FUNG|nr:hypothetical protein K493DRAFT_335667 [Basidiobolus meristosporus CBS 931.73]|eukprot:ORX99648.1 hypothetical protein K493DRAFT_335667 [Basidiobolus meristosporus CBS 931.73]
MISKLKLLFFFLLSSLLLVNSFPLDEYFVEDLTVNVETLHVSPKTKVLAISINQIDQVVDENGDFSGQARILALNLKIDERQLIDEGPMFYRNVPVYAIDVDDKVDLYEAELMNQSPDLLPVKMYAWADVEYDEDQDLFVPRVVLQTQVLDKSVAQDEVVQVVIDLPENGDITVYPPNKLPLDKVYYRPEGNQPWMPFSELDDEQNVPTHGCGGRRLSRAIKSIQAYLNSAAESFERWYYDAVEKVENWANEHVGGLQFFALIWMSIVAVIVFLFALPTLLFLRLKNLRRQARGDTEQNASFLPDHLSKNEKSLSSKITKDARPEQQGLLEDHE